MKNNSLRGASNQGSREPYPPNNNASNEGDKTAEVNEENEDKQLLGKKRKSTNLQQTQRQSNIHSLPENLENLSNLLTRINYLMLLEIMNEFFEELEEIALCEASTEAPSDSDEKEENEPNNEDQN